MSLMFKIPKKVFIVCQDFDIVQDKKHGGGFFNLQESRITIGTRDIHISPDYTFMVLIHEISEAIHVMLNSRYESYGKDGDYKFVMDHKEFENHNSILSGIIHKQILKC